jgi:RNA polymerase sigma-70 factor, ECF subfamily
MSEVYYMSESEKKLLDMAKKGNIEAFEKLIEPFHKKIYNIVLKTCGSGYNVSELSQEVFVRVFKSLKNQHDYDMFNMSMYKAVKDVCIEYPAKIRMIS